MEATLLDRGREAYGAHRWRDAFDAFSAVDVGALDIDDLERLATAAYMVGEDDASSAAWTQAHQGALRLGDPARAARFAFSHAGGLVFRGEMAPAMGWIERGKRVLDEGGVDGVERAWYLTLSNLGVMFMGDPASAQPRFVEALRIATRFDDPTAAMLSRLALGQSEIMLGRLEAGCALLDEVMVAVTAGEVAPIFTGIAYCAVIDGCQRIFDLRRAKEWTAALSRWCDQQQGLVPYRGNCLVHRCEIFHLQGAWIEAMDAAQDACDWLAGPPPWDSLGGAAYLLGEIRRLKGDLAGADEAYRLASQAGRDPEPGMSLLRMARRDKEAAVASIGRLLEEGRDPSDRSKILVAAVEILSSSDDVTGARAAARELSEMASSLGAPLLNALAAQADGTVLLAERDAGAALRRLRDAAAAWQELGVPYERARTRVLIGVACRELGDDATAELEFDAARATFADLGAAPDVARVDSLSGADAVTGRGGLTQRELEVIRHVAAGKTNRAIATELVLSEKTVARHVANIFTKLGVSSRSAATAYAYEHDLV